METTLTHETRSYFAKELFKNQRYVMPMYHFRCSCGYVDEERRSPGDLGVAMAEHEAQA